MALPAESTRELHTADEVARLEVPGKSTELVRGRLVVREPPSTEHGRIQANLAYVLTDFVKRHGLGAVFGQDTGFKIASDPDTVRAPDVAFVALARVAQIPKRGYAALAPDLVVEIVSPEGRPGEVLAKVGDWLDAGTKLVWVIDPGRVEARFYRADGTLALVSGGGGVLDGEDVVPGFTCMLGEILG